MPHWILRQELHANTRRTRITLQGWLDGEDVALKCYRAPLFGLLHWFRTHRKAQALRRLGIPLPPVLYSGWLSGQGCFCIAYRFMDRYERLRERLDASAPADRWPDLERLVQLFARCHQQGVIQNDANLTNFLLSPDNDWVILDEDDIQRLATPLTEKTALHNLAAAISRVPDLEQADHHRLWQHYISQRGPVGPGSFAAFQYWLQFWQRRLAGKIRRRDG